MSQCKACKKEFDRKETIRIYGEGLPDIFCSSKCYTEDFMRNRN